MLPRNYGKNKPMDPLPDPSKEAKEAQARTPDTDIGGNGLLCALRIFGLKGFCPTDDPDLYICVTMRCTPKCGNPYDVSSSTGMYLSDPEAGTTCVCTQTGWNPQFRKPLNNGL